MRGAGNNAQSTERNWRADYDHAIGIREPQGRCINVITVNDPFGLAYDSVLHVMPIVLRWSCPVILPIKIVEMYER
jgi:hypothetical protein